MATDHASPIHLNDRQRALTITEARYLLASSLVGIALATALHLVGAFAEFGWILLCVLFFGGVMISLPPIIKARPAAERNRQLDDYYRSSFATSHSPFENFLYAYVQDCEYGQPHVSRRQHYLYMIEAATGYALLIRELRADKERVLAELSETRAAYETTREYFDALLAGLGVEESSPPLGMVDIVGDKPVRGVGHGK